MIDPTYAAWPEMSRGDQILIRERLTARELTVTVTATLPPIEGEGPGIIDDRGRTIRHHFYDARPTPIETLDQQEVDRLFAHLTAPTSTRSPLR